MAGKSLLLQPYLVGRCGGVSVSAGGEFKPVPERGTVLPLLGPETNKEIAGCVELSQGICAL
ncbi:MAG: hypothetical protein AB8G23_22335 [Myxococcota bacterium]